MCCCFKLLLLLLLLLLLFRYEKQRDTLYNQSFNVVSEREPPSADS